MVPTAMLLYTTLSNHSPVSPATWRVLFCLYGAPILMLLILPAADRANRLKSEIFLDLFQVAIVVALAFSSFFYLPLQQMLPDDALVRNLNLSNLLSVFLLVAVLLRLIFTRNSAARSLLQRLGLFLLTCGVVTCIGNWIDLRQYATASAWWDLGWALPYVAAALVTITWFPAVDSQTATEPAHFLSFLGKNVALVAILFSVDLMMDRWKAAHGAALADALVGISLLAFSVRMALTQFHQHQEIAQRKAAQEELLIVTETINGLLEDARIEANAIAQISLLGSLLQAAATRDEVFRTIPDRLARLLPGTSGVLSVLNASGIHAELVAEWGSGTTRRPPPPESGSGGSTALEGEDPPSPTGSLQPDGSSVSLPLLANGEALGVLTIRDDQPADTSLPSHANEIIRRQQLGSAVAEQIALTISNLDLREALRVQATHDPLTGLYNRRSMEEALEREGHRARRRGRPLAVMLLDVDHFKRYNDTFGHAAGDDVLLFLAETLMSSVRAEDLVCRYGGEEFVVLLPECLLQHAAVRAEEVRNRLKEPHAERDGKCPRAITVSIGVAAFQETTDSVDLLLKFADEALYQAKHAGRDRVVVAQPAQAAIAAQP